MAEILGPAPDALGNEDIIKRYDSSLTQLTKSATDPQYDFERQTLINNARYQWMMIRGFQNLQVGFGDNGSGGQMADWVPFDNSAGQEETGADVRLCPPVNFLAGDLFKFMAVMGSSSPRVKAVADDLRNPNDVAAAQCADTNIRDLWIKNKIDRKWKIPAFHLYTTGPCFARGFWNTDPVKYGTSTEPKIEVITGPDGMPFPKVVGSEVYDNGDAELSFHSVLEVSIPWEAKELRGNPLRLERMMNKWSMLAKYPGKDGAPGPLDAYRDSDVPDDQLTGSSVSAAEARQATANPSGTAQTKKTNQWRFVEWWIPPYLYESIISPDARKIIKNQFSRGLYLARVGSITVEINECEVTEEWTVVQVNREEKIMDRPICADNVPLQRAINDLVGMAIETVLRAITQTIMDNQLIDRQAMSTKEAVPAEIILTALPVDGDISKRIYQIPPARLSDQVLPLMNLVRTWGQDISGVRPELSGGGQPTQTFREAKQRKDQALAQLAPQAQSMRDASEDIARILVTLRSKFGSGTVKAQRKGAYGVETDVADMADLQTAGWNAQSDDQFPLTLSDKRDTLYSLLKEFPPEVQTALSLLDPLNIEENLELLQIPGYVSATQEQKQKTLKDIDNLLQGAPIMPPPGPPGAKPGTPQPSIPVDAFDDHVLVTTIMARWLVSPVGQKHAGTPGFFNVVAKWAAHKALATPPVPPPPPPMKGSMAVSLKAEDVPNMIPGLLEAAGIPAASIQPPTPPAPPPGPPPPPAMAAPHPIGAPPLATPIHPLADGPQPAPPIPAR
jgi:hypothetical protein